ncbi:hypothetical protein J6Z48_01040 [bacterium]|nr:hypothetical protein [bacterium]
MIKYKLVLLFLLLLLFFPGGTFANEHCEVVSGDGKSLGSEIACGSEHFYVLDSNENSVRMLAKYNLYTGYIIDRVEIEREPGDSRTYYEYCNDLATERGVAFKMYTGLLDDSNYYIDTENYCYLEKKIETDTVLQSEEAIGAHIDSEGNYLYPQIGDNYLRGDGSSYTSGYSEDAKVIDTSVTYDNSDLGFKDYVVDLSNNSVIGNELLAYKNSLESMNVEVSNIDLLSLSELDGIINRTTNKNLPLIEWGDNVKNLRAQFGLAGGSAMYNILGTFGNIRDYVLDQYSWLYSTTYWNKTIFKVVLNRTDVSNTYGTYYYVFTGSMGKICAAGFAFCIDTTQIGCGIRPVVTIPNEIQYLIKTITDGNGTIDVVENSLGGEVISFRVNGNKGFKLSKLIITTDSGETVEFNEGETVENADGTISIDSSKFTMPFENVTIEARWLSEADELVPEEVEKKAESNPVTGDEVLRLLMLFWVSLSVSICIGTYVLKRKF